MNVLSRELDFDVLFLFLPSYAPSINLISSELNLYLLMNLRILSFGPLTYKVFGGYMYDCIFLKLV